jgi:hypothetical protein
LSSVTTFCELGSVWSVWRINRPRSLCLAVTLGSNSLDMYTIGITVLLRFATCVYVVKVGVWCAMSATRIIGPFVSLEYTFTPISCTHFVTVFETRSID